MLAESVFHTDALARSDRFGSWRERFTDTLAPSEITSPRADDFWARQQLVHLEDAWLWPVSLCASRYRRTPRLIRQSDPELLHMTLVLPGSGAVHVDHNGHRSANAPFDLYFLDTSRPYDVSSDGDSPLVGVGVEIPRSRLQLPDAGALSGVLGRRLSGRRGFGALLSQFLVQLSDETSAYELSDAPRLNGVLLDLVAGLVSRELDAEAALPPETRTRNLVLTIRSFILRNFRDPRLTPQTVAAAHHLSTRHLHRLFQPEGVTVAALIRHRRLEQARRELADPALLGLPVQAIAARCGFTASAHFSRAFRGAYGDSPSEYRHAEQRGVGLSTVRGTARPRCTSAIPAG
ncbi:helix-turn-helix domain-containing protein [Streptomyces parvus]|uniref:Helix-turn-helix domain-containing protein n=1 Tax=Streptomyces parvus TaxID=66428 RepID=A0A5D4IMG7_9ACTN|nr:helix-turn-helix domain-containing protein [Streptomyces parvus]TYR53315.1 helix-turn-helix domain-containing protein [Streptomyces parvus]